jgi:hypothetical protein
MVLIFYLTGFLSIALMVVLYDVFPFSTTVTNVIALILLVSIFFLSSTLNEVYAKRERYKVPIGTVSFFCLVVIGIFMFGQELFTPEQFVSLALVSKIAWVILMFLTVVMVFNSSIQYIFGSFKAAGLSITGPLLMSIPWVITILYLIGYVLQDFVQHELLEDALPFFYLALGITFMLGGWFLNEASSNKKK